MKPEGGGCCQNPVRAIAMLQETQGTATANKAAKEDKVREGNK